MSEESHADDTESRVISKIQKLLAKTKDGSGTTEAESDTAMRLVQKLLMEHNLDMATVEAAQSPDHVSTVERVKEHSTAHTLFKWERQLAKHVAEAHFCYYLLQVKVEGGYEKFDVKVPRKITRTHVLVGRKGNVTVANLMYAYLVATVKGLVPRVVSDREPNETTTHYNARTQRAALSFKEGCVDRICERLATRRQDLMAAHDQQVQADVAAREAKARAAHQAAPKALSADPKVEAKGVVSNLSSSAIDATDHATETQDPDRPVVAEEPWQPPSAEGAPVTTTALALASVYDETERELNEELAKGWPVGTYARWRAELAERQQKRAEAQAQEVVAKADAPVKAETEAQRRRRETQARQAAAANRRRWAREDAAEQREADRAWARRDHDAYAKGQAAGKTVGLDTQVGAASNARQLKE